MVMELNCIVEVHLQISCILDFFGNHNGGAIFFFFMITINYQFGVMIPNFWKKAQNVSKKVVYPYVT